MKILSRIVNWYFSRNALPYWCILLIDYTIIIFSGLIAFYFLRGGDAVAHNFWNVLRELLLLLIPYTIAFRIFHTYSGIFRYSSFVDLLEAPREKALLWHCTAGKDRAGFAAAIVLEILGAEQETILEDYIKTNAGLAREIEWIYPMIGKQAGGMTSVMRKSLDFMFLAHKEYLLESYRTAEEQYGGMESYIEKALGVDAARRRMLQDRYLV